MHAMEEGAELGLNFGSHDYLCFPRRLSVAFLHLDPGVRVGREGGEGVLYGGERLLAGRAGLRRVPRRLRTQRSFLHRRRGCNTNTSVFSDPYEHSFTLPSEVRGRLLLSLEAQARLIEKMRA